MLFRFRLFHLFFNPLDDLRRGGESEEGGGIVQPWIADPNVYDGMPMPRSIPLDALRRLSGTAHLVEWRPIN